jgi:hypothetical protein
MYSLYQKIANFSRAATDRPPAGWRRYRLTSYELAAFAEKFRNSSLKWKREFTSKGCFRHILIRFVVDLVGAVGDFVGEVFFRNRCR